MVNFCFGLDSPYILENLKPQTTYSFRFAAQNDVGKGPWSNPQVHTTAKRSAPEEPQIINKTPDGVAMSSYFDRFEVIWKIPADNGERIDEYSVKSCPVSNTIYITVTCENIFIIFQIIMCVSL